MSVRDANAPVSVPIFRPITLLNLDVDGTPITFGVFGYCVGNSGGCSERKLGYGIPSVVSLFTQSSLYTEINNIVPRLTTALVLHPIAAGTSLPHPVLIQIHFKASKFRTDI